MSIVKTWTSVDQYKKRGIYSLSKRGHPNTRQYRTIQCWLRHLLEEYELWHISHASDRTWQENHVGSMGEFQTDSPPVSLWSKLSSLLLKRCHSCCNQFFVGWPLQITKKWMLKDNNIWGEKKKQLLPVLVTHVTVSWDFEMQNI